MVFSRGAAALSAVLFVFLCCSNYICHTVNVLYFAESFSLPTLYTRYQVKSKIHKLKLSDAEVGEQNLTTTQLSSNLGYISNMDESEVLLACRAYLRRKHKIEWTAKKQRAEAAASPLNNEGYFWYDPNELMYLREDPDPYNLNYNETDVVFGSNGRRERKAGPEFVRQIFEDEDYLNPEPFIPEDLPVAFSTNPFSTAPLHPPEEHVRRSAAKVSLWNNQTWREMWYKRRWGGKVLTEENKRRKRRDKLLDSIPSEVLDSEAFDQMSQNEVMEAIITYMNANERRLESRKRKKVEKRKHREVTREWKRSVKEQALTSLDAKDARAQVFRTGIQSSSSPLSFTPSVEIMQKLRAKRAEQSKKAFQTRLMNSNSSQTSSSNEMTRLRRRYKKDFDDDSDDISPVQAILRIDMALDHKKLPSSSDVEIMLKPGRLGRRRAVLKRILNDCFDLRGKCVPPSDGIDNGGSLLFVTKCTIDELGSFVLAKMSERVSNV
eukprot:scaffold17909_cov169-Skeletonema_marinoi.AAC.1